MKLLQMNRSLCMTCAAGYSSNRPCATKRSGPARTDGGNCGDDLAKLEFVEDCGFTSSIQTDLRVCRSQVILTPVRRSYLGVAILLPATLFTVKQEM